MALEPRKRLGRGLDALLAGFPDDREAGTAPGVGAGAAADPARRTVPVALVRRNPRNPRRSFRPEELDELARSLKQHGLVQPIAVRAAAGGAEGYEIIAGERRWRAAQLAGLHEIPVTILDVTDREALELAIVENVQRADLNPVEEARGYQALMEEFDYTQADLGDAIGKSRVHVTNTLRLLRLPESVLALLEDGTLSAGHGRAILGSGDPARLAQLAVERSLSVRDTERLAQDPAGGPPAGEGKGGARSGKASKSADVRALEKELTDSLGLFVRIDDRGEGHGDVIIRYKGLDQLDAVCRKLRG